MKRIGTFLIAVALVVGMVGCGEVSDNGNGTVSYQLTVSSTSGGSVVEPGEGVHIYEEETVVELVAVPDTGYRFVNWTGDVDAVANVDAASTTMTLNGDYAVTANFVKVYSLTISSTDGGSVTIPGEGAFTYDGGTVVNLVASPASGYRFFNWTGDVDAVANLDAASTTITLNGDYSITARFVAQYTLTIDSTDGGHVTKPGGGTYTYDAGTVVDLMAEAWEGYKFLNWTGDVKTIDDVDGASTTVTMDDNYAVSASFLLEHLYLDEIGPGLWNLFVVGEGVGAAVTDYGVVVSISSEALEDPEGKPFPHFLGGGWKLDLLEGDFDIRMSYEMIEWPQESGAFVGLTISIPSIPMKFVNIERIGLSSGMYPWLEPREVYQVLVDNQAYSITGTDDVSGTLRICREGTTVRCYYGTPENWHELYEAEWSTMGVHVMVGAWSNNSVFGGDAVSVRLRTVEIAEPGS